MEARWRAVVGAPEAPRILGYVARTHYKFPDGEVVVFLVENDRFQEAGFLDANGRAYRREPFEDEPKWVLTGTMDEGVRALLKGPPGLRLERLAGDWSPAAFSRPENSR